MCTNILFKGLYVDKYFNTVFTFKKISFKFKMTEDSAKAYVKCLSLEKYNSLFV